MWTQRASPVHVGYQQSCPLVDVRRPSAAKTTDRSTYGPIILSNPYQILHPYIKQQ